MTSAAAPPGSSVPALPAPPPFSPQHVARALGTQSLLSSVWRGLHGILLPFGVNFPLHPSASFLLLAVLGVALAVGVLSALLRIFSRVVVFGLVLLIAAVALFGWGVVQHALLVLAHHA